MEPERAHKWNSKISAESKMSNRSSCRSLDRGSWELKQYPLNKQFSMVEVMSLEGSRKSDIYEKMLAEEVPTPQQNLYPQIDQQLQAQEQSSFNPLKTIMKFGHQPTNNRFSYDEKQELDHTCTCYISCNLQNCPCFRVKDQPCKTGFCCPECVSAKAKRTVRSGVKQQDSKIMCTCKKTKCNKKYCTCYAAGLKCGYNCSCQDCLNCDKPAKMEMQPVCIVDQQIQRLDMPLAMQFQPFAFRMSQNSNN